MKGSWVRPGVVHEPLQSIRAEHGLPPDPELAMLSRYLVLSPFPPSFREFTRMLMGLRYLPVEETCNTGSHARFPPCEPTRYRDGWLPSR